MHSHVLAFVAFALFVAPASAQTASTRARWDYLDRIALPVEQQDQMTKHIVEALAGSKVKTARDAEFTIIGYPTGSPLVPHRGLRADELGHVTGLFYVEGGNLPGSGERSLPELVWEVRFVVAGIYVRDVFWVVARTGAVFRGTPTLETWANPN